MSFGGLPRRVQYTPVPNPMFGTLLEQIDDLGEFKCTLRLVWMLHRHRGHPKLVTLGELKADRTLARSLAPSERQKRHRTGDEAGRPARDVSRRN